MKMFYLSLIIFVFSCNGVLGMQSKNEKFIQGKWRLSGSLGNPEENRAWLLEWEFKDGDFIQSGYPPILQKGKYKVIENKGNRIKLKLLDQKGTFGADDRELLIIVNKKKKTLTIDGKDAFTKYEIKK